MASDPIPSRTKREGIGLPPRVFFYTIEQISALLNLSQKRVEEGYIHFDGRSVGAQSSKRLLAVNIAPHGEGPAWRVSEDELIRWCKKNQVRLYERGWAQP